jgi:hypothetical protein
LCFLKFSIFVVLEFLECLLYILVDHIQYHLYKILIDYLQDLFYQVVLVSFIGFFGIVYLRFVGVWIWASVFFIPSGSCINLLLGGNWFPSFSVFPSLPLLLLLSQYCV